VVTAKFDIPKLEKSLKKAAKKFGDTTAQAVTRWGIQVCRELAVSTQVYGKSKTRDKQISAIIADAYNVLLVTDGNVGSRNKRGLFSPEEVNDWIDLNRTRRRARTAKLPHSERKYCTRTVFDAAIKIRSVRAGMAKGGWLGVGMDLAKGQTGAQRINIGKNFLGYAQKHSAFGEGNPARTGWTPRAVLHNQSAHSASNYVLSNSEREKAIGWGLKKTLTWYRTALRKSLEKP
jgi:hypothetical protein